MDSYFIANIRPVETPGAGFFSEELGVRSEK